MRKNKVIFKAILFIIPVIVLAACSKKMEQPATENETIATPAHSEVLPVQPYTGEHKQTAGIPQEADTNNPEVTGLVQPENFEMSYEKYNGVERAAGSGEYWKTVDIPTENTIEVVSLKGAMEVTDGVLFLGYPTCPHCRNIADIVAAAGIELRVPIYYCQTDLYANQWKINAETGKPEKVKKENEYYYDFLTWLDVFLEDYVLTNAVGEDVPVGERRAYVPVLFKIKGGVPVDVWRTTMVADIEWPDSPHEIWSENMRSQVKSSIVSYIQQSTE